MRKTDDRVMRITTITITLLVLLIGGCTGTASRTQSVPVIAVWNLECLSIDSNLPDDIEDIIANKIITTVQAKGYEVVEREQLLLVLEELNLGSSGLASLSSQLKIGHLSGARWMIFGGYQEIAGQLRLDLRIVDVATSQIIAAAEKTVTSNGDLMAVLAVTGDVTRKLILNLTK